MAASSSPDPDAARSIVLSRTFDAPRDLVFEAWTTPDHVREWFGPQGFTLTVHEMDVRPGGRWRFVMHGPDGIDFPNLVSYVEVVPPERLVYDQGSGAADDRGFRVTIECTADGERTRMSARLLFPDPAARDHVVDAYGAIERGHETCDRLAAYLQKRRG